MFVEIFIALSCLLIQPIILHYIGNFDDCTASKICNHTWTPICGHNKADSSYRLFLDKCDLHEYNCENNITYVEEDTKVCREKCTQKDHAHGSTAHMPTTTTTEVSTITKEVTETITHNTDTAIFVAPTTIKTTKVETENTTVTTTDVNKSTDVTIDKPVTNSFSETTEKESFSETDGSNNNNFNEEGNKISEETTPSTRVTETPKQNLDCYPKHCSMPFTWETTSVGEKRDFVQILRERYGDRMKFLRDTTHFPKTAVNARKSEAFIPGRYMKRG